ncbi:hypothetical protein PC116_g32410 [Phytophthora cactorum]|nr:hypothetical protein PC116_g32410 [Phytophthora cactorum]
MERHGRGDRDVELMNVSKTDGDGHPTRKMTLSKHGGAWRGMSIPEQQEEPYKSGAYTRERELP